MIRLTTLCVIMLFTIVNGRFYKHPTKILTSQKASDIAQKRDFDPYSYEGFINHASGEVNSNKLDAVDDAKRIIRKKIAQGLREHFGKLQAVLTAFADDDGFVREGIVFCGASDQEGSADLFSVNDTKPEFFHENSARLIEYDGWGVVENNVTQAIYDAEQCGIDNCQEGSVVSALANEIRSTGYQIQHRDICLATANKVELAARSANLKAYSESKALLCDDDDAEENWYDLLRDCIGVDPTLQCGTGCAIQADSAEGQDQMCWVDPEAVTGKCDLVQEGDLKADENIAASYPDINALRRVMRYSLNADISAVQTTDYAYITGCETGGCTSLRNLFAALNGNAQISAFRDLGVEESVAYWETEIKSARTYLQGLADTFKNFRPLTLELFPFIEEEEIEGCPMGEIEKDSEDTGTENAPLCYQDSLDLTDLNKLSRDGQFISRSTCFCRNGKLEDDARIDIEKDDIYLSVDDDESTDDLCAAMPASVRTYCGEIGSWGSRGPWRGTLESLLPGATIGRIKIYDENSATHLQKRQTIVDNLVKTLPAKLDTSCGRIITADHNTSTNATTMLLSNKGGNCLPFSKLNEIIYRLEYETGEQGMGHYKCEDDNTCPPGGVESESQTVLQSFCADKVETTEVSFRQLAYKWDVASVGQPRRVETDNFTGNSTALSREYLTYTGETYTDLDNSTANRSFCLVDWLSEFGLNTITDSGGHSYSNPFELIKKYIEEAVFNTELAESTKNKVIEDNILIWKAIRKELTSPEESNILDDISKAAATHYLYVYSTDEDLIDQRTFRDEAKIVAEIQNFTAEVQPFVDELPTVRESLDNVVDDIAADITIDINALTGQSTAINTSITASVDAAFGQLQAIVDAITPPTALEAGTVHQRRLRSGRKLDGDHGTAHDCGECFSEFSFDLDDTSRKVKALQEIDALPDGETDSVEAYYKAELKVLVNALFARSQCVLCYNINDEQTVRDTLENNRSGEMKDASTDLANKTAEHSSIFFELQFVNNSIASLEYADDAQRDDAKLTEFKTDQTELIRLLALAATDVATATVTLAEKSGHLLAAQNYLDTYWRMVPEDQWHAHKDEIFHRTEECIACFDANDGVTGDYDAFDVKTVIRPTLPDQLVHVTKQVKIKIGTEVAALSTAVTTILEAIKALGEGDDSDDIVAAKTLITDKIEATKSLLAAFRTDLIGRLTDIAEYKLWYDQYNKFWSTVGISNKLNEGVHFDFDTDTWPSDVDFRSDCLRVVSRTFISKMNNEGTENGVDGIFTEQGLDLTPQTSLATFRNYICANVPSGTKTAPSASCLHTDGTDVLGTTKAELDDCGFEIGSLHGKKDYTTNTVFYYKVIKHQNHDSTDTASDDYFGAAPDCGSSGRCSYAPTGNNWGILYQACNGDGSLDADGTSCTLSDGVGVYDKIWSVQKAAFFDNEAAGMSDVALQLLGVGGDECDTSAVEDTELKDEFESILGNLEYLFTVCSETQYANNDYVAAEDDCENAFPFADPTDCKTARDLVDDRKSANNILLDEKLPITTAYASKTIDTVDKIKTSHALMVNIINSQRSDRETAVASSIANIRAKIEKIKEYTLFTTTAWPYAGDTAEITFNACKNDIVELIIELNKFEGIDIDEPNTVNEMRAALTTAKNTLGLIKSPQSAAVAAALQTDTSGVAFATFTTIADAIAAIDNGAGTLCKSEDLIDAETGNFKVLSSAVTAGTPLVVGAETTTINCGSGHFIKYGTPYCQRGEFKGTCEGDGVPGSLLNTDCKPTDDKVKELTCHGRNTACVWSAPTNPQDSDCVAKSGMTLPASPLVAATDLSTCVSDLCFPGQFWTEENNVIVCNKCPVGEFSVDGKEETCTVCADGKYTIEDAVSDRGATVCLEAAPGQYAHIGHDGVSNCQEGFYLGTYDTRQQTGSGSPCIPAATGFMVPGNGAAAQIPCSNGKYQDGTGKSSCKDCPQGYVSQTQAGMANAPGPTYCMACTTNKYQDYTASSTCKECPYGSRTYGEFAANTACNDCLSTDDFCDGTRDGYVCNSYCFDVPAGSPAGTTLSLIGGGDFERFNPTASGHDANPGDGFNGRLCDSSESARMEAAASKDLPCVART